MAEDAKALGMEAIKSQQQALEWMDKMLRLAQPESVFGKPVEAGDYTVITASEAWAGMGFGLGAGGGKSPDESGGEGSGAGGGGVSSGRPVAAITVGPGGVRVEPVVDFTKISLAFISVLASLIVTRARARRALRD